MFSDGLFHIQLLFGGNHQKAADNPSRELTAGSPVFTAGVPARHI